MSGDGPFRNPFIAARLAAPRVLATRLSDAPCVTTRARRDRHVHMLVNTNG